MASVNLVRGRTGGSEMRERGIVSNDEWAS